jgi:hypothetical protein
MLQGEDTWPGHFRARSGLSDRCQRGRLNVARPRRPARRCLYFAEVEANVSNKGKNWIAAEDEVLKQGILRGASLREISKELDRTERSVRSRASTLRLLLRSFGVKRTGVRKYG